MSHTHGAPDNQAGNLDDILGRGKGDFDMRPGRWVGADISNASVRVSDDTHWSDLPAPVRQFEPTDWYASDNDARSPLEADLEDIDDSV